MLEPRIYRAGLLLSVAAAVVLMFSVVSRPQPLRTEMAPDAFDGARAAATDRQLLEVAPEREPGGDGDARAAQFVAERFRAVQGGQVVEQSFEARHEGETVEMTNVSLVLPGTSDEQIVIIAARDCDGGPCAVSSGAATAALLELAAAFDGARHSKTLAFVSTDGSVAGAAGARALAGELAELAPDAVISISQPGSGAGRRPFVVPWSAGPQSTSIQLLESASAAVAAEAGTDPLQLRTFPGLFRLAIPSGLGEQAVLIERGVDAIGISSAGERPVAESEDTLGDLDPGALERFGRATLSLVFALDAATEPLEHGPDAYLPLTGKLLPGWSLALLAAALLVPIGLVSADGLARASRANEPVARTLGWVLTRSIPLLAALALTYLFGLLGVVARPGFPFDPASHPFGIGPALVLLVLVAAFVLTLLATRPLAPPARAQEALTPAIGLVVFVATALVWFADPYTVLLLVPAAHLWLAAALPDLRRRPAPVVLLLGLGLLAPLLAIGYLAAALGAGWGVPWQLLLMVSGQHFGPPPAIALCVLGGCLVAIAELARGAGERQPWVRLGREPVAKRPGPGALGGPPSAPIPGRKF